MVLAAILASGWRCGATPAHGRVLVEQVELFALEILHLRAFAVVE
jgi:hypothetical protein